MFMADNTDDQNEPIEVITSIRTLPCEKPNKLDDYVIDNLSRQVWGINKDPSWSVGKKKPNPENRDPRYREGQGTFEGITNSYRKWAQEARFNCMILYQCKDTKTVWRKQPKNTIGNVNVIKAHINSIQLGAEGVVTAFKHYPQWNANRTLHLMNKDGQRTHKISMKYNGERMKMALIDMKTNRTILSKNIKGKHISELLEESKSNNEEGYLTYGLQTDDAFTLANAFNGIRVKTQGGNTHQQQLRAWIEAVKRIQ